MRENDVLCRNKREFPGPTYFLSGLVSAPLLADFFPSDVAERVSHTCNHRPHSLEQRATSCCQSCWREAKTLCILAKRGFCQVSCWFQASLCGFWLGVHAMSGFDSDCSRVRGSAAADAAAIFQIPQLVSSSGPRLCVCVCVCVCVCLCVCVCVCVCECYKIIDKVWSLLGFA